MKSFLRFILLTVCLLCHISMTAQPLCKIVRYTEDTGLAQWHVTQMLQDTDGMMWFSTWNGLDRFDGNSFTNFKSDAGDECVMPTDRIRNIRLNADGEIVCKTDEGWYLFDRATGDFSPSKEPTDKGIPIHHHGTRVKKFPFIFTDQFGVRWQINEDGLLYYHDGAILVLYPLDEPFRDLLSTMEDRQHNLWLMLKGEVARLTFQKRHVTAFPVPYSDLIGCFFLDKKSHYWLGTKGSGYLQVFNSDNSSMGYVAHDGSMHTTPTSFGSPIYRIAQTADGVMWLGSKPDGLFRLREKTGGFIVDRFSRATGYPLPCDDVYDIKEDAHHRLWVATMGGGLCCILNPKAPQPDKIVRFIEQKSFPTMKEHRVRFIYITKDQRLLAATTEGLLVGDVSGADPRKMTFRLHRKEAERSNSLSSNATMDILEMPGGRVFVSTESGGVNEILTRNLLAESLDFRHYGRDNGLSSDVTIALAALSRDEILIVGSNKLMALNIRTGTSSYYDRHFFHASHRFSEARPLLMPDGRWLIGTFEGVFTSRRSDLVRSVYEPPLLITRTLVNGEERLFRIDDMLTLQPDERNLTIAFASLDYAAPEGVNYAYRLGDGAWTYLGHDCQVSFVDLTPGTYALQLRATNGSGEWNKEIKELIITVKPYFFETILGKMLLWFLAFAVVGGIVYTYLYIRRINRQRREALEAYLALIDEKAREREDKGSVERESESTNGQEDSPRPLATTLPRSEEDDAFMQRVMRYVEQHIGDADANVVDMAREAATSKSGLNRKMKSIVGLTPADFLREARIKRACHLLTETSYSVADITYRCGFTDPKYFAKCFKASVGKTPTDYRC